MSSPFDNLDAPFHVLVNHAGQHSLWPAAVAIPDGWSAVLRDRPRQECVAYVDAMWTDMRPRRLVEATDRPVSTEEGP